MTQISADATIKEMKNKKSKSYWLWLGAILCCFLWGSAFPSIKIGYALFEIESKAVFSQILFAGMRFALAGVLTILVGSILQKRVLYPKSAKSVSKVFTLSLFQTIGQYTLFYLGLAYASGVKASIINGLNVFVVIIIAGLVFRMEKITAYKWIGCLFGVVGVVLVNLTKEGIDLSLSFRGEGFVFLSAFAYAISSILIKKFSVKEDPVMLSGYQFFVGGMVMVIIGLIFGGEVHMTGIACAAILLYLAFISACAYTIWGILLKNYPVSKVSVFGFLTPIFGALLSAVFLNEGKVLDIKCFLALCLVSIGIYISFQSREKLVE